MVRIHNDVVFRSLCSFLFIMSVSGSFLATSLAAEFDFATPIEIGVPGELPSVAVGRRPHDPEHIERRGHIRITSNALSLSRTLNPGDLVNLKLFANIPHRIIVQKRETDRSGNTTITGHLEGQTMQTFVMTINQESFVISLQDLSTDMTYWVNGETIRGEGSVEEHNNRKRPPRIK